MALPERFEVVSQKTDGPCVLRVMSVHDDERLPSKFEPIADLLRENRENPSALEMDALKQRVSSRGSSARSKRSPMKSRLTAVLVALASIGGTAGLAVAGAPKEKSDGKAALSQPAQQTSAAETQYRPGKGCGDKNHEHREDECKMPPK